MKQLYLPVCTPPAWAKGGHLQTLWGHFLPSPEVKTKGIKRTVELVDGDRLVIEVIQRKSPIVVSLYHGLSGSIESDYMRRTANLCEEQGYSCVLVNHRGAGDGFGLAKKPYHSGIAEDVSQVLEFIKSEMPGRKNIAVGFSMSGNILLNLVSGHRGSTMPDAAISVNAPIRLLHSSLKLNSGLNRLYDWRFVNLLSKHFRQMQNLNLIDPNLKLSPSATVWEMDEIYTAPLSGFKSREDYYESCSSFFHTHKIKVPTYVLTAEDDPFVEVRDYLSCEWSRSVYLRIEKNGGHLGYLDSAVNPQFGRRWLDQYLKLSLTQLAMDLEA